MKRSLRHCCFASRSASLSISDFRNADAELQQSAKEPNANEIAMLLANMAKSDALLRILHLKRPIPKPLSSSPYAIDQLMDCFVKGAEGRYNKNADFDYLSYLFADLAKVGES